jgi:PPOX class probable F420-dependent enzyme
MELTAKQTDFLSNNHNAVFSTFRRNGAAQLSIVTAGLYDGAVAFTTTANRVKHRNLTRDPRCSLLVSHDDWRPFLVLEGNAEVLSQDNTDAEALCVAFRDVFRAAAGKDHPNWDEYDRVMVEDHRVIVVLRPEHVYGTLG